MKVIAEGEVFTTKDNYISYILLIIVCGMYYKDHEQVLPAWRRHMVVPGEPVPDLCTSH
jgi:hypothetical protein